MNTLTILVIIYLALTMTRGFFRGFIKTLFSMVFFILVLVTAAFLAKPVTNVVSGSKNVKQYVEEQSGQFLEEQAKRGIEQGNGDNSEAGLAIAILGSALQVNGVRTIAAEKIADFMLHVIGYLAALILAAVIWIIIEIILNKLTKNHTIGGVNRFFGLFLGLFRGLIVVWIVFGVISALQFTGLGSDLESQIQNSALLNAINQGNIVARYLPQFLLSLI